MLNVAQVGTRIQERRRAQGLTQEQLGAELSVSAQAVSKWETGESAPDIGILPSLCHTLGISADTLLGISGGPGAEQLASELRGRLRHMRPAERERALFAAVKLLLGTDELDDDSLPPANSVICLFDQGSLAGLRLILTNGFAGLVLAEALNAAANPPAEQLAAIRTLVAPGCLEVALALMGGAQRESELLSGTSAGLSADELRAALTRLLDAGLIIQGRTGYRLEDAAGYAWVGIIAAIAGFASPTKIAHSEVNSRG
jgi:transcriptional regulator with XRE-family HTH domain